MQWILLTGDAMLGRGIDQIQAHPCDPALPDPRVRDARDFVLAAEARNGPIGCPVDPAYIWGDAPDALAQFEPALRIINLETAITTAPHHSSKPVTYRMNPANLDVIRAFSADCCVLSNNHVLDWQEQGLIETLDTLDGAGLARAGAGYDEQDAWRATILPLPGGGRVIVLGMADRSSGVPQSWAAGPDNAGVAFLERDIDRDATRAAVLVDAVKREGDIAIASVHWGGNWGFAIPRWQVAFARALVDRAGIDVVHGHSSHHPRQIGLYRGKPVLFGCGDLINDYEGIRGHEEWRKDLAVLYLVGVEAGAIRALRMLPMRIRRMRLERARDEETRWLCERMTRNSEPFGTAWSPTGDGTIDLLRHRPARGLADPSEAIFAEAMA